MTSSFYLPEGDGMTALNWTTTKVPMWQIDCEAYRKLKRPFELRDATTVEHEKFIFAFCARYDWLYEWSGHTVVLTPR
jgi:hypothetical protein